MYLCEEELFMNRFLLEIEYFGILILDFFLVVRIVGNIFLLFISYLGWGILL